MHRHCAGAAFNSKQPPAAATNSATASALRDLADQQALTNRLLFELLGKSDATQKELKGIGK